MSISGALATQLLNAAPDPTVMVDSEGAIIYANARVEPVLGYTSEELIGKPIEVLLPHRIRDAHPTHRGNFFKKPKARAMGSNLELYALRKDGAEIPVEISLNLLETEHGRVVSSAIRDMSESKALAQQLAEADRAKTRFLAAASHDLRQPIQAINLVNEAIRRVSKEKQVLDLIDKQQKSVDSMGNLLNSLLNISQLEAGAIEPNLECTSVSELVENLTATFEIQAINKGLCFRVEPCNDWVYSDSKLLSQILENFISNAIRYTDVGEIRLHCDIVSDKLRLQVTDTGVGIATENLDSIFEEYSQIALGRAHAGLGLGLSIVSRTADLLKCKVGVKSTLGCGSCFFVEVPLAKDKATTEKPENNEHPYIAMEGNVLVVDDEPDILDATCMLLELEGYQCMSATSLGAVETILSEKSFVPDLLITDFHLLKGETGLQVIDAVRRQRGENIPAILVSGDTSNRTLLENRQHISFIAKPVDVDFMMSRVADLIRRQLAA